MLILTLSAQYFVYRCYQFAAAKGKKHCSLNCAKMWKHKLMDIVFGGSEGGRSLEMTTVQFKVVGDPSAIAEIQSKSLMSDVQYTHSSLSRIYRISNSQKS